MEKESWTCKDVGEGGEAHLEGRETHHRGGRK